MHVNRIDPNVYTDLTTQEIKWEPRYIDYDASLFYRGKTITNDEYNALFLQGVYQGNYITDSLIEILSQLQTRIADLTKTYVFEQAIPSATWEIQHNLNKHPSVTVVDSGGDQVLTDVNYVNANKIILQFSAAFSGKAYLN